MSGMRPTGKLHLGHWLGVLTNWVELQEKFQCYFMVADWHALTTKRDESESLSERIHDIVLDWLAVGIDPEKAVIYTQSSVTEIAELHLLLSMFTPVKWVETDPTLKDMVENMKEQGSDALNYGLLGYPILQTADILSMGGELVPVGKDQEAHLEISRSIAKRFNHETGTKTFAQPKPLFTDVPSLIGLDGRKMSKSYDNAILLSDSEDDTLKRIKSAMTDPARIRKDDVGNPDNCTAVFPYYHLFANADDITLAADECRTASRGCMDCKKILAERINEKLRPIRERRAVFASDPAQVNAIIEAGTQKARARCQQTLHDVKTAMKMM